MTPFDQTSVRAITIRRHTDRGPATTAYIARLRLHGAACHGCTLIAETSCEMRNEYLDRALAVPTLYAAGAAFFGAS